MNCFHLTMDDQTTATSTTESSNNKRQKLVERLALPSYERQVSSSLIAERILPFLSRHDWTQLSRTDRELLHESQKRIPPWPHKTLNLRGSPWPVSLALSSPFKAEWMACGAEGFIRLFNNRTGFRTILNTEKGDEVQHVEFSPKNPNQLLSCSNYGVIRLWNLSPVQDEQSLRRSTKEHAIPSRLFGNFKKIHRDAGGHTRASFSPNGEQLACATWRESSPDPRTGRWSYISLWNVDDGCCLKIWGVGGAGAEWGLIHNFGFHSIMFHPNYNNGSRYLVTQYCDKKNTAQVWDLSRLTHDGRVVEPSVPFKNVQSGGYGRYHQPALRVTLPRAVLVPQGVDTDQSAAHALLALGGTNRIGLWSIPEGSLVGYSSNDSYKIMVMAASPSGEVLATSNAVGDARLWRTADGALLRALEPSSTLCAMAFTDEGRTLVCLGMTGMIYLCDASF